MTRKYTINNPHLFNIIKECVNQVLEEERKTFAGTVWITYGSDKFDKNKFEPITLNWRTEVNNKPASGGLWACPVKLGRIGVRTKTSTPARLTNRSRSN